MKCHICEKELEGGLILTVGKHTCGSCIKTSSNSESAKSLFQVKQTLRERSFNNTLGSQETNMKKVKVKSNSIRSRIHVLGDIQLSFDDQGIAEMPAHLVPALALYLRAKPGRFEILEEEKPAKPEKVEAPKAEVKSDEKSEDKPEKKEEKKAEESDSAKDESEESNNSNKKSKKGSSSKKK